MHILSRLLCVALSATALPALGAQDLRAVTEDGRKVFLSPDGKWRFAPATLQALPIPEEASPYQPVVKKFSVNFDTASWNISPKRQGDEANKRSFQHKSLPLYAIVVSDELPATTAAMRDVILYNARSTGASTTILKDETIKIGGKDVGSIRFAVALKGLEFMYASYYYADGDGNIQVSCYTAQSLFAKYQTECQQFLSGLTIR